MCTTCLPSALAILAVIFVSLPSSTRAISDYSGLPPGPYCGERYPAGNCCFGRKDECSAPILGTLCYCDDFCNRTRGDDCCPDYWSHCKGITFTTPSPPQNIKWKVCSANGKTYYHGESFKDNCNKCKCSALDEDTTVTCEMNRCLIDFNLLHGIKSQQSFLGWYATNYSEFWGRTLHEGVRHRLGTLNPISAVYKMSPIKRVYDPSVLPKEFDARQKWPGHMSAIRDQGWCGASWAISTADVASDRYFIMSSGKEAVKLSAQHLVNCDKKGQQGCDGGHLDKAWFFTRKSGLVEEKCYPWTGRNDKCRIPKNSTLQHAGCGAPMNPLRREMYKVGPAYRIGNEYDIMQEITKSGPVQATMKVYQDFFMYKSGVYSHSKIAERYDTGYHSVRIIGWGEDVSENGRPVKYWLAANSWGTSWGENGLFRILRGTNECEIESFVLGVWAKTI